MPTQANAPAQLTLEQLQARIARIPGVAAADGLSFVDLPPGSLRAGGVDRQATRCGSSASIGATRSTIRRSESPPGRSGAGSALLSAEASRALSATPGATVELEPAGRAPSRSRCRSAASPISSQAKPLFSSRNSTKLEDFLYVPDAVVVSPATFKSAIVPAFQAASAARGTTLKSLPVQEVDVLVDRSRLHSDPARALAQTEADRAVDRPDRARPGLPDRQHLEHARGGEGRRGRGQADVLLPRPARASCWRPFSPRTPAASSPARSGANGPTCASAAPIAVTCCGCSSTGRSRSPASARRSGPGSASCR